MYPKNLFDVFSVYARKSLKFLPWIGNWEIQLQKNIYKFVLNVPYFMKMAKTQH